MKRYTDEMNQKHELYDGWLRDFRNAIFINDHDDIEDVKQRMKQFNEWTDEEVNQVAFSLLNKRGRIRRHIPAPEILRSRLNDVMKTYHNMQLNDNPLITEKVWAVHEKQMKHVMKGCVSDHPEVNYYTLIEDGSKHGSFKHYLCKRGTSQNESFHRHSYHQFYYITNMDEETYRLKSVGSVFRWNLKQEMKVERSKIFFI